MTSADVVGPDRAPTLEEEQLPGGVRGLWERAWLNLRTGNLGPAPIIVGEIAVVIIFGFTATNFFTAVNFVDLINQTAGTAMLAFGVVMLAIQAYVFFGPPPASDKAAAATALIAYAVFAVVIRALERRAVP